VPDHAQPVVVAFDGSGPARAAVDAAVRLFPGRPLLIASVWEPAAAGSLVAQARRDYAATIANEGLGMVRAAGAGAGAEAVPMPDSENVAETLLELAERADAAALVVGSRGHRAVRSSLFGSTSTRLLHESRRPVVVVRDPG
jgi:nucleotide-binding universal stress UspA family protein